MIGNTDATDTTGTPEAEAPAVTRADEEAAAAIHGYYKRGLVQYAERAAAVHRLTHPPSSDVEALIARLANHAEDLAGAGVAGLVADLVEAGTRLRALPHPVASSTGERS